jgi:Uma2 family endonuclease
MATARRTTTLMTAEDLLALPDDGFTYELVEGELRQMPPTSGEHSRVELYIAFWLMSFVYRNRLGKVYGSDAGFRLKRSPDTVLCPDTSFVRTERVPQDDRSGIMELAPDLAVEVISPSNTINEMDDKVAAYLEAGTSLIWVVRPRRRQVTVYTPDGLIRILGEEDVLDGGDVLPGFSLPVVDVFRDPEISR